MGFVFVIIAVSVNMVKSYGSKRISGRMSDISTAVDVSLFRNLLCAALGAVIVASMGVNSFELPPIGWLICSVAGVAIGLNYVVWVLALKTGVYVFANAANTASFMVAAFCGTVFWGEELTLFKGLAIILILTAMLFMGRYQSEISGKISANHVLLLVLVFLSQGLSMTTQKWFTRELPAVSVNVYTFYALLISSVLLFIATFFISKRPDLKERTARVKGLSGWVAVMAVCFYLVTFFQTKASALLDTVVTYPVNNGLALVAGNVMAWTCFSEKPTKNSIIGMFLVFSALMFIGLSK